jgi:ABC-type nitrate/sulfonate/bicarbonate transport system substrate-binding protein
MLTPPASDRALAAGGVLLAKAEDYVPGWPLTCGWTLRSWLVSHRQLAVRFIRAWVAATDWLLAPENRAEGLELMMSEEDLSRGASEEAWRKVVPKARINSAALKTVIELRKALGVYKPPHSPPERFYDAAYWTEATGLSI